jgi:hypothetical protein
MTHRLLPFLALPALLASTSFETRPRMGETPAEPAFDPSQSRMLFSENFDNYSFEKLHPKCGSAEPPHAIIDHSWGYCKQFTTNGGPGVDLGVNVVPGHAGNGVAWHYDGVNQETHGVVTTGKLATPTGKATTVVQYWARYQGDAGHSLTSSDEKGIGNAIVQIKNIMLWHDQNRFQIDLHSHQGGCPVYGPSYTMLEVIDQVDGGCNSSQPVGPFFKNFADGQWHRWTILYKPNTAKGSRDGRALLWIDGKLVIRIERPAVGVTPAGGWKPWCSGEELDALYSGSYGVGFLEWGANRTDASGIPFTMAIDDLRWWVEK